MSDEVAKIAGELSEAQRRYMTTEAQRLFNRTYERTWWTFPPHGTHHVLMRLRLVEDSGQILPLGLAVRDHINKEKAGAGE